MPVTYQQIVGRDVWHFHPECHHLMRSLKALTDKTWRNSKPRSGEMCNECQAKARADKRLTKRKRG